MTTRTITKRVNEINQPTGVPRPYGVRCAWRVRNPEAIEKSVHARLSEYRVRDSREFFDINFRQAVDLIDALLTESEAQVRERGVISLIFRNKGYGFLTSRGLDFFFHARDVEPSFNKLCEGDAVQFNRIDTSLGLAAVGVRSSKD